MDMENNYSDYTPIEVRHNSSFRNKVFELEAHTKLLPQLSLKLIHHFADGVYARELHIPAGSLITGQIHKYENLNILSKGSMRVLTDDGMTDVEAPFTVISPPGTKRAAYAHTDCVWTTILKTDLTTVAEIEKYFIAETEEEYLEFVGVNQLELGFN